MSLLVRKVDKRPKRVAGYHCVAWSVFCSLPLPFPLWQPGLGVSISRTTTHGTVSDSLNSRPSLPPRFLPSCTRDPLDSSFHCLPIDLRF
jgi:hypothetical protein